MWLGDVPCEDATQLDVGTITCTTANPSGGNASLPKPQGPQPVRVVFSDWGVSACNASTKNTTGNGTAGGCVYQFVDLWSRRTTWGGGEPPAEGDTVLIPGECRAPTAWALCGLRARPYMLPACRQPEGDEQHPVKRRWLYVVDMLQATPPCYWMYRPACMLWCWRVTCCLTTLQRRSCICRWGQHSVRNTASDACR